MKTIKLNTKGIIHHLVLIIVAVVIVVAGVGVGVYEYSNHHKSHAAGWQTVLAPSNGYDGIVACEQQDYFAPDQPYRITAMSGDMITMTTWEHSGNGFRVYDPGNYINNNRLGGVWGLPGQWVRIGYLVGGNTSGNYVNVNVGALANCN